MLEDVRLRLHVDRIVGTRRRGGIDIAKIEKIVVDSLDLDRSLGLVYARLGDANEGGGDDAEEPDPRQRRPAPVQRAHAIHDARRLAGCGLRAEEFEIRRRVPGGNVEGHGSASSIQNQLSSYFDNIEHSYRSLR